MTSSFSRIFSLFLVFFCCFFGVFGKQKEEIPEIFLDSTIGCIAVKTTSCDVIRIKTEERCK